MTLAQEIIDWVEDNINMTLYIHPQWHKKLREWGFRELGNNIDTFTVTHFDDEVANLSTDLWGGAGPDCRTVPA